MATNLDDDYSKGVNDARQGRYEDAIARLTRVITSTDFDFGRREHARMLLGYAKAQLDDWDGAIECFKAAMINDIECLPAHTALGHAYLMADKLSDAVETFRVAIQKDPNNAQARHGLGWALLQEGKNLDEALHQNYEALRLSPKSAAIRDSVGWTLYKLGDLEAAAEQLEEAVKLDPDHRVILSHWKEVRSQKSPAQSPESR